MKHLNTSKDALDFLSEIPELMATAGISPEKLEQVQNIRKIIFEYVRINHLRDLGRLLDLPFQIGDKVYIKMSCESVCTHYDRETNASECPFENDCPFEECNDNNERVFKTTVESIFNNGHGWCCALKGLCFEYPITDFGKRIFFTYEEADKNFVIDKTMT